MIKNTPIFVYMGVLMNMVTEYMMVTIFNFLSQKNWRTNI